MRTQGAIRLAMFVTVLAHGCGGKTPAGGSGPDPETGAEVGGEPGDEPGEEPAGETGTAEETAAVPDNVPASSMAAAFVTAHNTYRARHCTPPLAWSEELAKAAQSWADSLAKHDCAFEHSRSNYGENLAGGTSGALDAASATEMWYREVDAYDFARGGFSMDTGHFTQLVWAGTTHIGCGVSTCKGQDRIVCNYDPPGNVDGGYRTNVKATGCK